MLSTVPVKICDTLDNSRVSHAGWLAVVRVKAQHGGRVNDFGASWIFMLCDDILLTLLSHLATTVHKYKFG